jgi:hypothetical protein
MTNIVEKRESNSGNTLAVIEEADGKFIGTVTYTDNDGNIDTDTQKFATLPDAQGWLELTYIFMLGVHADS